jgi:hypothetical protein
MYRATVAAISRPIEKICAQLRAANQLTALDTAHSTELNDE